MPRIHSDWILSERMDLISLIEHFRLVVESFGLISDSFRLKLELTHALQLIKELPRIHSDWLPTGCVDSEKWKLCLNFLLISFSLLKSLMHPNSNYCNILRVRRSSSNSRKQLTIDNIIRLTIIIRTIRRPTIKISRQ